MLKTNSQSLTPKSILVTGGAGFIGFHLAQKLIARGDEVVGLDNINDYYDVNLKYARLSETGIKKEYIYYNKYVQSENYSNYKFIKLDLNDKKNVLKLFQDEKFDKVCNLAAQAGVRYSLKNPYAYIDSNILGFLNILEGCRFNDTKHLIYASSSSVYGSNTKMPLSTSDNVDHPISLYAVTKKSNELIAHAYSHLFGFPSTGLRFFTVYGPWGRPDMALFLFTKAILNDEPINVFNHGNMIRDFTYIDDIVEGIVRVIDHPPKSKAKLEPEVKNSLIDNGQLSTANCPPSTSPTAPYKIYNIGNSSPVKLMDFIKVIEDALGKKAIINMKEIQQGDVPKTYADVNDLECNFKYKPKTSIREGIFKFIDWYNKYFNV